MVQGSERGDGHDPSLDGWRDLVSKTRRLQDRICARDFEHAMTFRRWHDHTCRLAKHAIEIDTAVRRGAKAVFIIVNHCRLGRCRAPPLRGGFCMISAEVTGELDFDTESLGRFLQERFGQGGPAFRLTRIGGGQSNPSYFLDYADHRMVLRKQPAGEILRGAHAVDREYRVLEALAPTGVPVPRPVLYHGDADLLGTPFYLMERVDGRVFADSSLEELPASERRAIWIAVADAMAAMHSLRPDDVGLADYGKPGSYFERQVGRWNRQYHGSPSGPIPSIERLYDWLVANQPPDDGQVSLCHGDFRLGNLLFHPTEPRVAAILDWELSTLGHPLADLAFCCMPWHTAPDEFGGLLGRDLGQLGLPDEDVFVTRYRKARPSAPLLLPFHKAFALYRFAVIFVGIADRAKAGNAADPNAATLGPLAERFAFRALEIADGKPHS